MGDEMFVSSPKRQARIAGALYLVVILAGMFAEVFVRPKIYVPHDAAATARNLIAHASLYRAGLLTDLLTIVAAVAEGVIVYRLFRPINGTLALTGLLIALVSNAGELVSGLIHLLPLVILGGADVSAGLSPEQLEQLASLAMRAHNEFLGMTLGIFSFSLFIDGYLVCLSTFLPKALGVIVVIASACYLINSVANLLDLPLGLLDGWILIPSVPGRAFAVPLAAGARRRRGTLAGRVRGGVRQMTCGAGRRTPADSYPLKECFARPARCIAIAVCT